MATLTLDHWKISIGDDQPLVVIAGLNVLEDLDLALKVGRRLKAITADLALPYVFKASFDKANRSSIASYRGPGLERGLELLKAVKTELDAPICTDVHEIAQAEPVAAVADLVQIPAFLCRQTDLVIAAAKATQATGGLLHIKKGQFLAAQDCRSILDKVREATNADMTILCERGVSFGYGNLVVDMLGIPIMQALGAPVSIDATHAVQLPGAQVGSNGGASTGGRRSGVPIIAKAAVAAGADAVFLEFHPDPDNALCDGPSALPLDAAEGLLRQLKAIREALRPA